MAPTERAYRIDGAGVLWQRCRPGLRSPRSGWRRLGTVTCLRTGRPGGTLEATCTTHAGAAGTRTYRIRPGALEASAETPPIPTGSPTRPPISGGSEERLEPVKVIARTGPLVLVEQSDGGRFYLVLCPHCGADLSTVSMGRLVQTPAGALPELWHPVRCPECRGALVPQPSSIVPARTGTIPRQ